MKTSVNLAVFSFIKILSIIDFIADLIVVYALCLGNRSFGTLFHNKPENNCKTTKVIRCSCTLNL